MTVIAVSSPFISEDALDISTRLRDGRKPEALSLLYEKLRAGKADADVQRIAADFILDLVEPHKARRGRPRQVGPQKWSEIGSYYERERAKGLDHAAALRETWADFTFSKEHIRKAVKMFKAARGEEPT